MKEWKGFKRGVNLGGWLSQCDYTKEHYDGFITEADIEEISKWGLDHLRLPVDYNLVEDENGAYVESGFAYIEKAIEWCGRYGLNLLLDLHKTAGYSFYSGEGESGLFDSEAYQERFYRLWEQFARRFGNIGDRVAFELLNEVTDKSFCDKWNEISNICISRIRKIAPSVKILVGGYWNNSVEAVKDIAMPADENIVYNFHCYDPLIFTHQGAHWIPEMPQDFRLSYHNPYSEYDKATAQVFPQRGYGQLYPENPSAEFSSDYFRKIFAEALKVAKERDVLLYCGEYGVIELVGQEDVIAWYEAIHEVFEENNIGRAAWSYKSMNFGIADERMDGYRDRLLKLL